MPKQQRKEASSACANREDVAIANQNTDFQACWRLSAALNSGRLGGRAQEQFSHHAGDVRGLRDVLACHYFYGDLNSPQQHRWHRRDLTLPATSEASAMSLSLMYSLRAA